MMTMEMGVFLTAFGMLVSIIGAYVAVMTTMKLKLQHLEDTKVDKSEIHKRLDEDRRRLENQINALDRKVTRMETKIDSIRCLPPGNYDSCLMKP